VYAFSQVPMFWIELRPARVLRWARSVPREACVVLIRWCVAASYEEAVAAAVVTSTTVIHGYPWVPTDQAHGRPRQVGRAYQKTTDLSVDLHDLTCRPEDKKIAWHRRQQRRI
jgi:hypothetical protein